LRWSGLCSSLAQCPRKSGLPERRHV
jgi:hypothetical protein